MHSPWLRAFVVVSVTALAGCGGEERPAPPPGGSIGPLAEPLVSPSARPPSFELNDVHQLDAGRFRTCAVRLDGAVFCWGDDLSYWSGPAGIAWRARPVDLPARAWSIGVGDTHACALLADRTVVCWGSPTDGRLGSDETPGPTRVLGADGLPLTGVEHLAVGAKHACAAVGSRVFCWGQNLSWQVTGPVPGASPAEPVARATEIPWSADKGGDLVRLFAGETSTCVARSGAAPDLVCWGRPPASPGGMIGGDSGRFVAMATGLAAVTGLRLVDGIGCATGWRVEGEPLTRCWGSNRIQDFGAGLDWAGAVDVDAGSRSVCAAIDGGVSCRQGLGEAALVRGVSGADQVVVGELHACVLLESGTVRCWGENSEGQLGLDPSAVASSSEAAEVRVYP